MILSIFVRKNLKTVFAGKTEEKAIVVARIVGTHVDDPTYIHSVTEFNLSDDMYEAVKADYDLVRNALLDPHRV